LSPKRTNIRNKTKNRSDAETGVPSMRSFIAQDWETTAFVYPASEVSS
jgi:hypothetical protein